MYFLHWGLCYSIMRRTCWIVEQWRVFFGGLLKLETEFLLRYNENNAAMDLVGASGFWVHVLRLVWLAGMLGSSSFGASPRPRHLVAMPRVVWNPVLLSRCRRELFVASIRGREQRWNDPCLKFQNGCAVPRSCSMTLCATWARSADALPVQWVNWIAEY